jgi:hypothetical protein
LVVIFFKRKCLDFLTDLRAEDTGHYLRDFIRKSLEDFEVPISLLGHHMTKKGRS